MRVDGAGLAAFFEASLVPPLVHLQARARGRMIVLTPHLQGTVDRGVVTVRAAIARKLGLKRERVTQLLDRLLVASDLQAQVLELDAVDGAEPMSERALRVAAHIGSWSEQRAAWATCKRCS